MAAGETRSPDKSTLGKLRWALQKLITEVIELEHAHKQLTARVETLEKRLNQR